MDIKEENTIKMSKDDLSFYLGTWNNPYEKSRSIAEFTFIENDGQLQMTIKNAKESFYQGDWGIGQVRKHAYAPDLNDIVAFQVHFSMDDMEVFLAINENKGLLVIAAYFTFKDEDERSDCFVREFFNKA